MPNFFEGMEVDSDEEEHVVATGQKPVEKRPKLTHQQRR